MKMNSVLHSRYGGVQTLKVATAPRVRVGWTTGNTALQRGWEVDWGAAVGAV
eukprot:COSAG02_NODE_1293_length_13410_cov_13.392004_8_plen_52_part_00